MNILNAPEKWLNDKFYVHLFCHNRDKYKKGIVAHKATPVLARGVEGQNRNPGGFRHYAEAAWTWAYPLLLPVCEQVIYKT